MASVRALQAKAREIPFGPLPGGLPAACFVTWSAFLFPSTPACPGTHLIVGWWPWVRSLLVIACAWIANAWPGPALGMPKPRNDGLGVQQDSDWFHLPPSLLPGVLEQLQEALHQRLHILCPMGIPGYFILLLVLDMRALLRTCHSPILIHLTRLPAQEREIVPLLGPLDVTKIVHNISSKSS